MDPEDLGEFTLTYELREVFPLTFPETFDEYVKGSVISYSTVRSVDYDVTEGLEFFSITVRTNTSEFADRVQNFPDPVLIGDAVCGITSEDGVLKDCVMAGIDGPIIIKTAADTVTLEELARVIQAFYALP